ncbi:alpha/beta hydrolase [Pseudomaricurvus alkylphenolicus]|uniref:alpha/beta fold hydrolase n=1 Tax=Pseudomaricurvus alkylphenolicus TaxID=1306991 RepID=UPI0014228EF5|nr:alpha/beta hydrolase [Pseudomaricurvus alkylphenolicus]NIB44974.1 alpha/beta hydrolase [Pseudomaricurvus alkylphenolicus]
MKNVKLTALLFIVLALLPLPSLASDLLTQAQSQYTNLQTPAGNIQLHYKTLGSGDRTTVLVHGGACDMTFWDQQVEALASVGKVILLDLAGHGLSDKPEIDYTMKLFAQSVNAVMEATNTEKAVFMGHSMGVPTLREFYRAWPEKMQGMVAVDGIVYYDEPSWIMGALHWLMDSPLYDSLWGTFVDTMTNEHTPDALRERVSVSMKGAPRHVVLSFMEQMTAPETAYNDKIDIPLLAIYAPSPAWSDGIEQKISAIAPNSSLVQMQGVSHFLLGEKPLQINPLLVQFVSESAPALVSAQ